MQQGIINIFRIFAQCHIFRLRVCRLFNLLFTIHEAAAAVPVVKQGDY